MLELRAGGNRVLLDPLRGGRVASWRVDGEELLIGPPGADDASIHWGCYLMAPWPGRLEGARFDWRGREVQVRPTQGRNAIHGLTWNRPWQVDSVRGATAELSIELPTDEWPMGGRVRQRVTLTASALRLDAEIEAGSVPMPAALGWHPWFRRRGDPCLQLGASRYLVTKAKIPTGEVAPASGRADLRRGPRLGRRRLDHAYVDARSPAVISWPDIELTIEFDPSPAPVVVYTPPHAFCVEPLTAHPNALALTGSKRREAGIRELQPGASLAASMLMSIGP